MKTLIIGVGPLGSLYAHLFFSAGKDVTVLARDQRYKFITDNGIVLVNEYTKEKTVSRVRVIDKLDDEESYDLAIVLIRKNKIQPVTQVLKKNNKIGNILFMGNNILGFKYYVDRLPRDKILFGFPGAGGSLKNQVAHFVDSEKPGGNRLPVTIGEMDGIVKDRTRQVKKLFKNSGIPVNIVKDIDGWLKYHAAFVLPIGYILYKHGCDNYAVARNENSIRSFIRACKEGGEVLRKLGYRKRQPFKFNFFYWMPEFMTVKIFKEIFNSRFAEIAFAQHARAGIDEMLALTDEFKVLIDAASFDTPNIDRLRNYLINIDHSFQCVRMDEK